MLQTQIGRTTRDDILGRIWQSSCALILTFKTVALACLLFSVCFTAHADFDEKYQAYSGDLDGNGYADLFLSRSPDLVIIPLDDLLVPSAKRRAEYVVLMQSANRTFTVNAAPSASNLATMKTWARSQVQLAARDLNVDGEQDLFVKNFDADPKFAAGTADQIVYSATSPAVPTAVAVTQAMRDFFTQIHGWILDRDYFIQTAIDNDWYHYTGTQKKGWWYIAYINAYYSYNNGKRFLDATDDPEDPNNVPAYCQDYPTYCMFDSAAGSWLVYGTYLDNIKVIIEYEHFNQDALSFAQAAGTAYDVPNSSADPTQAGTILEAKLGAQTGETVAAVLRYPVPRPDLPPEVTPEPPIRPMPPEWLPPATEPTFYPRPQLKWKILGKVTIWACVLFCIDKGPEDENEELDWYYFGLEWGLYDVLNRPNPSSQVKAVIGESEGGDVFTRIPSAAAAWGAIYLSFGVDPDTGRQVPFNSEPAPFPGAYDKFIWAMNSGWLAALMGKQAEFYDIQLYGPRPPPRGKFYPCERKILLNYPLRTERPWQGTAPYTGQPACGFF